MYGGHYTAVANCERIIHPVLAMEQEVAAAAALGNIHPVKGPSIPNGFQRGSLRSHCLSVREYLCAPYVELSTADVSEMAAQVGTGGGSEDFGGGGSGSSSDHHHRQWVRFDDEFAIGLPDLESPAMHRTIVTGKTTVDRMHVCDTMMTTISAMF